MTFSAILALALVVSACAKEASDNPFDLTAGGQGEQPKTPDSLDDVVTTALDEVQRFWTETYPEVYGENFEPISGGFHPYGPDTEPLPCEAQSYDEIADNAFYCPQDDLIAWDEEQLIPQLAEEFGPFTLGIVMAHEFGHAIQARGENITVSIVAEMQADCYAGSWTKWIAEGNSDSFSVTENELDQSVAGMIAISDQKGSTADDPMAHGAGFDRIGAFQDGFEHGAGRCEKYDTDYANGDLPVVEIPFFREDEAISGGDMPLLDSGQDLGLLSLAEQNLNVFYGVIFDNIGVDWAPVNDLKVVDPARDEITCDGENLSGNELEFASGYCQDENVAVIDGEGLMPALYELGDFAVGAELARLWAQAAQLQLDVNTDNAKDASLQADCLTGIWADANFPLPPSGEETKLSQAVPADQVNVEF
ncbi:MAG TPA: neutral zinc metallopeptidase, partial [Acidimicrobiales bacterium]